MHPLESAAEAARGTSEDEEVVRALDAFLSDFEAGRAADPAELLAQHPAIAHRLRTCLAGLQLLDSAAPQRPAMPSVLGDYTILREIGRGGMGVVYEALGSDGGHVALKVLPFAAGLDSRQLQRFRNEAHAASHLHHPHIVPVYEVGCAGGVHFFTMRLIAGASLATIWHRLRRKARPAGSTRGGPPAGPETSWDELPSDSVGYIHAVCRLIHQAALALDHAHQIGVVHRDIKPGNLLVDVQGLLWITDFGLASIQGGDGLTMTGDILGTLRFMSPEQASARRGVVDHRTDIYSLGITLYELLTLEPALTGRDRQEILARLANDEPRPCSKINPAIPRDLETIVHKSLAKEPAERYATAHALADDLGHFLANEPIAARRPGIVARTGRWARRHQTWVAAAGLAVLLAAIGLSVSTALIWRALVAEEQQRTLAEDRDRDSRRHLYAAHMNMAYEDWQRGNVARVLELLDRQQPAAGQDDLRGFEWHHLWRLCHHALADELRVEAGPLYALAVSADGSTLAAAGERGGVRIWAVPTRKLLFQLSAEDGAVHSLALTADGQRLAVGHADGSVRVWNLAAPHEPLILQGRGTAVLGVAFSPDGQRVISTRDDVTLCDAVTGRHIATLTGLSNAINCVAISPDGNTLAAAGNSRVVVLWNLAEPERPGVEIGSHSAYVHCLAFSPDSQSLISGSEDGIVTIWDVPRKGLRSSLRRHTGAVSGAAFAPDGQRVATCSWDGSVKLWRPGDETVLLQQGHRGGVFATAFVPGTPWLATSGEDGCVRFWNLTAADEPLVLTGSREKVRALAFAPNGVGLVSGTNDGDVRQWDLTSQSEPLALGHHADWVMGAALLPGGRQVLTADLKGNVLLHSRDSSQAAEPLESAGGPIWSLALSPDGRTLAAAGYVSNTVILWDVASRKKRVALAGHTDRVWSVAFAPDGRTLASAANDRTVRVWDATSGQPLASLSSGVQFSYSLAYSPDGQTIAVCGDDRRIHLWDVASEREQPPLGLHPTTVRCLAFFPDGQTLAVGGDDGMVRLWDLAMREVRLALRVPPIRRSSSADTSIASASIWSLAISNNGRQLAAGDAEGRLIVWRASAKAPGEVITRFDVNAAAAAQHAHP